MTYTECSLEDLKAAAADGRQVETRMPAAQQWQAVHWQGGFAYYTANATTVPTALDRKWRIAVEAGTPEYVDVPILLDDEGCRRFVSPRTKLPRLTCQAMSLGAECYVFRDGTTAATETLVVDKNGTYFQLLFIFATNTELTYDKAVAVRFRKTK